MSMRYRESGNGGGGVNGIIGHYHYYRTNGTLLGEKYYTWNSNNVGRAVFDARRCWDQLHVGPPWRSGGTFNKYHYLDGGLSPRVAHYVVTDKYGRTHKYDGMIYCAVAPSYLEAFAPYILNSSGHIDENGHTDEYGDCTDQGAKAWNKFRPGQPGASLAQMVAEGAELVPMLKTSAKAFLTIWKGLKSKSFGSGRNLARQTASNHLNNQFGWLPFVSDMRHLYDVFQNSTKELAQLRRDNGQWIHRSGTVRSSLYRDRIKYGGGGLSMTIPPESWFGNTMMKVPKGDCVIYKNTSVRTWFSGRFKYWVPNINTPEWEEEATSKLFGLEITPELVWELTPWSWLVDYFADVGDMISANTGSSLVDNLVSKYAYLMQTTSVSAEVFCHLHFQTGTETNQFTYGFGRKQRISASPFGFGLSDGDLSPRQLGILGALGVTRIL